MSHELLHSAELAADAAEEAARAAAGLVWVYDDGARGEPTDEMRGMICDEWIQAQEHWEAAARHWRKAADRMRSAETSTQGGE